MRLTTFVSGLAMALASLSAIAHAESQGGSGAEVGRVTRVDVADGADKAIELHGAAGGTTMVTPPGSLRLGDHIVTAKGQTVFVTLKDGSEVVVAPASEFSVDTWAAQEKGPSVSLSLISGMIHALVNKIYTREHPFVVRTTSGMMGVRGTEFLAEHSVENGTTLSTLEGKVAIAPNFEGLANPRVSRLVIEGRTSTLKQGEARPSDPVRFNRKTLTDYLSSTSPSLKERVVSRMVERDKQKAAAKEAVEGKPKPKPVYKPPKPKRTLGK